MIRYFTIYIQLMSCYLPLKDGIKNNLSDVRDTNFPVWSDFHIHNELGLSN